MIREKINSKLGVMDETIEEATDLESKEIVQELENLSEDDLVITSKKVVVL